ncbi:MAG: hypothetical protein NC924_10500, partial [Candidatus Omnitrophica bacterium]|nr:hypothetical protein [Candidatus Omnitrophota bacterium]
AFAMTFRGLCGVLWGRGSLRLGGRVRGAGGGGGGGGILGLFYLVPAAALYKLFRYAALAGAVHSVSYQPVIFWGLPVFIVGVLAGWEMLLLFSLRSLIVANATLGSSLRTGAGISRKFFLRMWAYFACLRLPVVGMFFLITYAPALITKFFPTVPELMLVVLGLDILVYFVTNTLIVCGVSSVVNEQERYRAA